MIDEEFRKTPVKEIIKYKASIHKTASIKEAVECMIANKTGVIAVLDDESKKFLGLFSKRHLIRRVILQKREKSEPISSVFTPNPISILDTATLDEAFVIMYKHNYKYLPVINEFHEFYGFIVAEDFLGFLEELYPEAISTSTSQKSFTTRDGA